MQQAIPYKSWLPIYANAALNPSPVTDGHPLFHKPSSNKIDVSNMVSDNAVIVFARRGCCMGQVMRRLLLGHGVNPALYEIDEEDEVGVLRELERITGGGNKSELKKVQFPVVFIGGSLFGGLDKVMAAHITGDLVPVLKKAGALWL